jgi:hypothetical protein
MIGEGGGADAVAVIAADGALICLCVRVRVSAPLRGFSNPTRHPALPAPLRARRRRVVVARSGQSQGFAVRADELRRPALRVGCRKSLPVRAVRALARSLSIVYYVKD